MYIDISLKDTEKQRQKKLFEVVLVDIKYAGYCKEIRCVKKPLDEDDLKFVALSYRWGELNETLIDTKVGYIASITSFALKDFYQLCHMMTLEQDLKHIKYVWVDAICVDQRPAKRKATIYKMNDIYDRATYILAVPDLHLAYLKAVSIKNNETINNSHRFYAHIYHLIHGNTDQLAALEEDFLDHAHVPKEPPALRHLLLKYTDHFADSFTQYQSHKDGYCPVLALDHICETNIVRNHPRKSWLKGNRNTIGDLHQCNEVVCPLTLFGQATDKEYRDIRQFTYSNWKSKVLHRSTAIRQSMDLMADIILDWSSRVWVISEFNIAKTKNNFKYWFTQLDLECPSGAGRLFDGIEMDEFTFFKFDFDDASFSDVIMNTRYYSTSAHTSHTRSTSTNPIYIRFHYTMIQQLSQQLFLEMILASKASRNEDRFYSILPLSPYKDKKTEVSDWKIDSIVSVKLKLYEIMNTKDKLTLLFWSSHRHALKNDILPTFATSSIPFEFKSEYLRQFSSNFNEYNFDLDDPSTLLLYQHTNNISKEEEDDDDDQDDGDSNRYYLRLKPKMYYVLEKHHEIWILKDGMDAVDRGTLPNLERLGLQNASMDDLNLVSIPAIERDKVGQNEMKQYGLEPDCRDVYLAYNCVLLVGSFVKNVWMIANVDSDHVPGYHNVHPLSRNGDKDNQSALAFFNIY
ncbi:unnamed protein product [Absidia cylindrospora]